MVTALLCLSQSPVQQGPTFFPSRLMRSPAFLGRSHFALRAVALAPNPAVRTPSRRVFGWVAFLQIYGSGEPALGRGPGDWMGCKDASVASFEVPLTHEQDKPLTLFPGP